MQGSVETAKGLLAAGNCLGFVCSQIKCPLNTVEHLCNGNRRELNAESIRKLQEFIKENSSMTKEDQIIEVVTAFKSGETIRRIAKAGNPEVAQFYKGGKLVQEWDFNNYRYEVVRVPVPQYRPLNPEELSCMVGTVLAAKDRQHISLTTGFNTHFGTACLDDRWWKADDILKYWLRLDGSPVGVLIK